MLLDATANCQAPLGEERLFGGHAALFPRAAAACKESIQVLGARTSKARCRWCPGAWLQGFLRAVHLAVEHALAGVGISQQRNA